VHNPKTPGAAHKISESILSLISKSEKLGRALAGCGFVGTLLGYLREETGLAIMDQLNCLKIISYLLSYEKKRKKSTQKKYAEMIEAVSLSAESVLVQNMAKRVIGLLK